VLCDQGSCRALHSTAGDRCLSTVLTLQAQKDGCSESWRTQDADYGGRGSAAYRGSVCLPLTRVDRFDFGLKVAVPGGQRNLVADQSEDQHRQSPLGCAFTSQWCDGRFAGSGWSWHGSGAHCRYHTCFQYLGSGSHAAAGRGRDIVHADDLARHSVGRRDSCFKSATKFFINSRKSNTCWAKRDADTATDRPPRCRSRSLS
jgi:hypothetical protein